MENNNAVVAKSIGIIAFSNIIKLLSSILVGFCIPKLLGVEEYGYYKGFVLYLTYVGLFHFGLVDGLYLIYSGKEYNDLDKSKFRYFSRFLFIIELGVSLVILFISLVFLSGWRQVIFALLSINLIAVNLTTYYQTVSQMVKRFKELAIRTIIQGILSVVLVLIVWLTKIKTYSFYTILVVSANYILLIWYIFMYKDITFGKKEKVKKQEIVNIFKIGIPLLIANFICILILTIDRQFVKIYFDIDTFSVYSFAYTMLGFITVFVSAISTVVFPYMKTMKEERKRENYSRMLSLIIFIVSVGLTAYFPLNWLVVRILPDYIDSLIIFRIILPSFLISSVMTIVKHNFLKMEGKNLIYFYMGIMVFIISIGANFIAYYIFKTTVAISFASLIVMVIWYIVSEIYFVKMYKVGWIKNSVYIMGVITLFLLITEIDNIYIGCAIYIFAVSIAGYIVYKLGKKQIRNEKNSITK